MPYLPLFERVSIIANSTGNGAPVNATAAALAAYNAQTHAPNILTFLGIIGALALIIVCLRIYVRIKMLKYVGADDAVMAAAMLCGVAIYICFIGEAQWGLGRHMSAISPEMLGNISHWMFFHNLLVIAGICLAKVSICLLLIRIVKHNAYVYFLWGLLVFIVAYHLACEGTLIFSCLPIRAQWDYAAREGAKCFSIAVFSGLGIANSAVNLATDILLAVLPIPVVMQMQLNRRSKIALCFVLALGFIAVGAGAVKLKVQITFLSDNDRFWNDRFPLWAAVELYFAIISASLPTLRPLVLKFIDKVSTSFSESAMRRSHRRNAKSTEDGLAYAKSPGTYCSECSHPMTPTHSSKDSYFSFLKKSPTLDEISPARTPRSAPIQLEQMAPPAAPTYPANISAPPRSYSPPDASEAARRAYIMRTTNVSTTHEEASDKESDMVPTSTFTAGSWGKSHAATRQGSQRGRSPAAWGGPEPDEWNGRVPSPRDGSIEHLVGNAR